MRKKLISICETLSLKRLLLLWFFIIIIFGLAYFGLSSSQQLTYKNEPLTNNVYGFGNAVYFSFITALTIGYGNIDPLGFAKILVVIEAMFSITIFGLIIYQIVSIKQEEVIEELHELTFEETSNEAISKLYLFRNDLKNIKESLTDKTHSTDKSNKSKTKINEALKGAGNSLYELKTALNLLKQSSKQLDATAESTAMRIELIANSINFSLSRLVELLETFNSKKIDWKKESMTATITENQAIARTLYKQYNELKSNDPGNKVGEKLEDLNKTLTTLEKLSKA